MMTPPNNHMTNYYRIIVKGALDSRWADWFDGFVLDLVSVNETVLSGPVQDQAALHGILAKVRDLGLTLLSVQMLEKQEEIDNSNGVRHVNKISGPSL